MTSNKPYLLRALNEWILDNGLTPHLIVDAKDEAVEVPDEAIQDGKLVLNISPSATRNLELSNEAITFEARFSGVSRSIYLPTDSVLAIYARENGQGMMFARGDSEDEPQAEEKEEKEEKSAKTNGSHLKLIK